MAGCPASLSSGAHHSAEHRESDRLPIERVIRLLWNPHAGHLVDGVERVVVVSRNSVN